jgi:hypothetical protein
MAMMIDGRNNTRTQTRTRHINKYLGISVYVDSGAGRLYRAGKASGWHAGVLLAAPTDPIIHLHHKKSITGTGIGTGLGL